MPLPITTVGLVTALVLAVQFNGATSNTVIVVLVALAAINETLRMLLSSPRASAPPGSPRLRKNV